MILNFLRKYMGETISLLEPVGTFSFSSIISMSSKRPWSLSVSDSFPIKEAVSISP